MAPASRFRSPAARSRATASRQGVAGGRRLDDQTVGRRHELDLRITLETDDGALVHMTFEGIRDDGAPGALTFVRCRASRLRNRSTPSETGSLPLARRDSRRRTGARDRRAAVMGCSVQTIHFRRQAIDGIRVHVHDPPMPTGATLVPLYGLNETPVVRCGRGARWAPRLSTTASPSASAPDWRCRSSSSSCATNSPSTKEPGDARSSDQPTVFCGCGSHEPGPGGEGPSLSCSHRL